MKATQVVALLWACVLLVAGSGETGIHRGLPGRRQDDGDHASTTGRDRGLSGRKEEDGNVASATGRMNILKLNERGGRYQSEFKVKFIPKVENLLYPRVNFRGSRLVRKIKHIHKDSGSQDFTQGIHGDNINSGEKILNNNNKLQVIKSTLLRRVNGNEEFNKPIQDATPQHVLCDTNVSVAKKYSKNAEDNADNARLNDEYYVEEWFESFKERVYRIFDELPTVLSDDAIIGEARSDYDNHTLEKKKKKKRIIWKFLLKAFVVIKVMLASFLLPPVLTFSTMIAKKAFLLSIMAFFLAKIAVFKGIVRGHSHQHQPVLIAPKWSPQWEKRASSNNNHFHVQHSHQFHHHAPTPWEHVSGRHPFL